MTKRKAPTLREKLAAALLHLENARCKLDGTLQECIDRERAKQMSPRQIEQHFEWDHHPVPVAWGGTNHPTNLNPLPVKGHRTKTAKKDQPTIAKVKRMVKAGSQTVRQDIDASKLQSEPAEVSPQAKKKWASRPMPGTIASGIRKPMRGKAVKRNDDKV